MTIERTKTGWIAISSIVNGHLVVRRFSGYTITSAKREFKKYVKNLKEGVL